VTHHSVLIAGGGTAGITVAARLRDRGVTGRHMTGNSAVSVHEDRGRCPSRVHCIRELAIFLPNKSFPFVIAKSSCVCLDRARTDKDSAQPSGKFGRPFVHPGDQRLAWRASRANKEQDRRHSIRNYGTSRHLAAITILEEHIGNESPDRKAVIRAANILPIDCRAFAGDKFEHFDPPHQDILSG